MNFYKNKLDDRRTASVNFWKCFSQTLNASKSKGKTNINKLIINKKEINDKNEIIDEMSKYLATVGETVSNSLPQPSFNFRNYLGDRVEETFYLHPVSESAVLKILENLNPNKSGGPDNFTPKLVKSIAEVIHRPLTLLFNKLIGQATFPEGWKLARLIALFKKGS